jgi:hypothetical protein
VTSCHVIENAAHSSQHALALAQLARGRDAHLLVGELGALVRRNRDIAPNCKPDAAPLLDQIRPTPNSAQVHRWSVD